VVREGRFYRTNIPIFDMDIGLGISVPIFLFLICPFFTLDISVWTIWSPVLDFEKALSDIPRPICP
jgi:hypothetical protein